MINFWSKVEKTAECWWWRGAVNSKGYGQFKFEGRLARAHRVAWELLKGKPTLNVLHRCDNPLCVNPDHLFLGTHADNQADKVAKGRQARGDKHGRSKLTQADVAEIRSRVQRGESKSSVARVFRVSDVLVGKVVKHHWSDAL